MKYIAAITKEKKYISQRFSFEEYSEFGGGFLRVKMKVRKREVKELQFPEQ